jgi:hypothetical protein
MNKGISIITSFGCPNNCYYCIMKQHRLYNYSKPLDLCKLQDFLRDNKDTSELSFSGGGDPLNNFEDNKRFYFDFLFPAVEEFNMCGVDIHTRIPLFYGPLWNRVNRCVFSIDFKDGKIINEDFIRWVSNRCKLRLFYCVLPTTIDKDIEKLIQLSEELECQVSIKQLHGWDDYGKFEHISDKYPELFKVYDKNYLIYYMPDNTITDTFMK